MTNYLGRTGQLPGSLTCLALHSHLLNISQCPELFDGFFINRKEFFQETVPKEEAIPGAVIVTHSFGDFLGWHPHLHVLITDGCFYGNGMFRQASIFELKYLEKIFLHKVFKVFLST